MLRCFHCLVIFQFIHRSSWLVEPSLTGLANSFSRAKPKERRRNNSAGVSLFISIFTSRRFVSVALTRLFGKWPHSDNTSDFSLRQETWVLLKLLQPPVSASLLIVHANVASRSDISIIRSSRTHYHVAYISFSLRIGHCFASTLIADRSLTTLCF